MNDRIYVQTNAGERNAWLLVANAGSDELSLFAVEPDGLRLVHRRRWS